MRKYACVISIIWRVDEISRDLSCKLKVSKRGTIDRTFPLRYELFNLFNLALKFNPRDEACWLQYNDKSRSGYTAEFPYGGIRYGRKAAQRKGRLITADLAESVIAADQLSASPRGSHYANQYQPVVYGYATGARTIYMKSRDKGNLRRAESIARGIDSKHGIVLDRTAEWLYRSNVIGWGDNASNALIDDGVTLRDEGDAAAAGRNYAIRERNVTRSTVQA